MSCEPGPRASGALGRLQTDSGAPRNEPPTTPSWGGGARDEGDCLCNHSFSLHVELPRAETHVRWGREPTRSTPIRVGVEDLQAYLDALESGQLCWTDHVSAREAC